MYGDVVWKIDNGYIFDKSTIDDPSEFVKKNNVKKQQEYKNEFYFRAKMETRWLYAKK